LAVQGATGFEGRSPDHVAEDRPRRLDIFERDQLRLHPPIVAGVAVHLAATHGRAVRARRNGRHALSTVRSGHPGACRSHGDASSSCPARASSRNSAPGGPTSCTATGNPSGRTPIGTTTAGKPATFHGAAYGANRRLATTFADHDLAWNSSAGGGDDAR